MIFKSVASFLVLSGGICLGQSLIAADAPSAPTSVPKTPVSFDLSAIDKTVDPCTDFYAFACGNWKKNNPVPADQTRWGRFNELRGTQQLSALQRPEGSRRCAEDSAAEEVRRLFCRLHELGAGQSAGSKAD